MIMEALQLPEWSLIPLIILGLWTLFWKGTALWHAARGNDSIWFIVLMVVNSVGILEIIYLLAVRKIKLNKLFR
jgi:hypothetical protein